MITRYYAAILLQVFDHEIIMHHRHVLLLLLLFLQLLYMKKFDLQVVLRLVTKEEVGTCVDKLDVLLVQQQQDQNLCG